MTTVTTFGAASAAAAIPAEASVDVADLGDRLRVTLEIPIEDGDHPSRRRALAKAWEVLAAAISDAKAGLPPMPESPPQPPRAGRKRGKSRAARTGSGSWWQF